MTLVLSFGPGQAEQFDGVKGKVGLFNQCNLSSYLFWSNLSHFKLDLYDVKSKVSLLSKSNVIRYHAIYQVVSQTRYILAKSQPFEFGFGFLPCAQW